MRPEANARRLKVTGRPGIYYRNGADGKRRYEITWLDQANGRRRWQVVDGNLEAAQAALDDVRSKVRRGERVGPSRVRFKDYAEEWLVTQRGRLRPKTLATYETHLRKHIYPRLGRSMLVEITEDAVASLIAEMRAGVEYVERDGRVVRQTRQKGYTPWTIRGALSPLSRVLGHAARRGMIAANPVARLERGERPAVTEKDKRILTTSEIAALLGNAPTKYRPLLATGLYTGLRLGELLGLTWADVDFEAGFIRVRKQLGPKGTRVEPKTPNAVRDVVLLPALGRLLKAHKEAAFAKGHAKPQDFVFASDAGTPLQGRNVSRRGLEAAVEAAGLNDPAVPKLTMHSLRDTFASHLILDLKLDVVQVSRLLGHSKPSITANTYARLFDKARHAEAVREAMIASAFGNALETTDGDRQRDGDAQVGVSATPVRMLTTHADR